MPFAGWSADGTGGDVLTVDDATCAGADACLTARRLGHEVMFFVNPFQIASGQPYFFSLLDAIIDARTAASVTYPGRGIRPRRAGRRASLPIRGDERR